jgi:tetratricopeptide (TPR) repeat protein
VFCAVALCGCVTSRRDRDVASEYYDLGNAYIELGKYDKAIVEFEAALKIDPAFVKADYNLALAYAHAKRTDDAIAVLKQLLAADARNTQLLSALGWAYHLGGRDEEAIAQYAAVVALSPADLNALYNSGIILWKLNRPHEAMDSFTTLLAKAPDDTDALYAAGSLLLSLDDAAASSDMLSRYLEKKPGDAEGWYLLAAGAERQKKYSRALEAYDKIIAIDPAQGDAWFGETRLLLTVVEDPQRGLDALAKALGAGFKDAKAVKALLDSPGLLERDKVEAALKDHALLPEQAPADGSPGPAPSDAKSAPGPASTKPLTVPDAKTAPSR